jgi:hypothetical protein
MRWLRTNHTNNGTVPAQSRSGSRQLRGLARKIDSGRQDAGPIDRRDRRAHMCLDAPAAGTEEERTMPIDAEAIARMAQDYTTAWNSKSADNVAAHFAEDGQIVIKRRAMLDPKIPMNIRSGSMPSRSGIRLNRSSERGAGSISSPSRGQLGIGGRDDGKMRVRRPPVRVPGASAAVLRASCRP